VCKTCSSKITDSDTTTSNFVRHLRLHKDRFEKYQLNKTLTTEPHQPSISQFMDNHGVHYSKNHPQQTAITKSLLSDLIVGCTLPLSIVENKHFLHFLTVLVSNYNPVCRRTLTTKIESLAEGRQSKLKTQLSNTDNLSVTVDIWSDRKMREFFGVTVHWMEEEEEKIQLRTNLLACNRFKGSHTSERICDQFEEICDEYSQDEDHLDDPELWCDLNLKDRQTIHAALAKKPRLQSFAHTPQLVVGDGLKETKVAYPTLSKLSKISSLLHTSTTFKDLFDAEFGEQRGIPAAVNTRWNSTLRQVKAVLQWDHLKLCAVLEKAGHKELSFTPRERGLLKELVEKVITVSAVVPSILSLNHHLEKLKTQVRFLSGLVRSLQASLPLDGIPAPFSDPVYLKAAVLDPSFALMWVEPHVLVSCDIKAEKDAKTTPALQLSHYLDIAEGQNAFLFWALNRKTFPSLFRVAVRVLAVPASTAPVERVFSHGGIIVRPNIELAIPC
uniref:BED-type domain-containing protein n=1 Tax=Oryzias melastigma TaxID=30732 RepID=A0A3B3DBK5_ORYME